MSDNPLINLYRNKSFYIKLPSNGRFYDSGITLSIDGELGIMPMTAKDELILKSPDSLFNGDTLIDVIKSCIPDIKNPREIPVCDIDPIILGIYIATNKKMDLKVGCSYCSEETDYSLDLKYMLAQTEEITENNILEINEKTEIHLRPYSLESEIKTNIKKFHYKRMEYIMKTYDDDQMPLDKKKELINKAFTEAADLSIELISDNIIKVILKDDNGEIVNTVTEKDYIKDWVANMDKTTHKLVSDKMEKLSKNEINKQITYVCPNCEKTNKTELEINPINFFIEG